MPSVVRVNLPSTPLTWPARLAIKSYALSLTLEVACVCFNFISSELPVETVLSLWIWCKVKIWLCHQFQYENLRRRMKVYISTAHNEWPSSWSCHSCAGGVRFKHHRCWIVITTYTEWLQVHFLHLTVGASLSSLWRCPDPPRWHKPSKPGKSRKGLYMDTNATYKGSRTSFTHLIAN